MCSRRKAAANRPQMGRKKQARWPCAGRKRLQPGWASREKEVSPCLRPRVRRYAPHPRTAMPSWKSGPRRLRGPRSSPSTADLPRPPASNPQSRSAARPADHRPIDDLDRLAKAQRESRRLVRSRRRILPEQILSAWDFACQKEHEPVRELSRVQRFLEDLAVYKARKAAEA